MTNLAIFDLDNTLIAGDSDHEWGHFLADNGIVNDIEYRRANEAFYEQYQSGTLDIYEFLEFSFKPLANNTMEDLLKWRDKFVQERIEPLVQPKAENLIKEHRDNGDTLLIITATNSFIAQPIAARLQIPNLIATEPEIANNAYTGKVTGTPCFQAGKIKNLEFWLQENQIQPTTTWFYSDSHNDIPLLEQVDNPVAVDADATLTEHASQQGWPQISLKEIG